MATGFNFDPTAHFRIGNGAVTLTEFGRQFAGNPENTAHSRGEMLAGMTMHIMNRLDEVTLVIDDADKCRYLYETVMAHAADAAQPPLSPADREQFMAGAHQILGGNA